MQILKGLLKNTNGNTLVGLLFAMTIFSVGILPIYKMIIIGAKAQKSAEETYEATLKAQILLESVKKQIEKDINIEYAFVRGLSTAKSKDWLGSDVTHPIYFIPDFLETNDEVDLIEFNEKYSTDDFLYELYIWSMPDGQLLKEPIVMATYPFEKPLDFSKVEIQKNAEKYFSHKEMSLWTDSDQETFGKAQTNVIGISEIEYQATGALQARGNGFEGENIFLEEIKGYTRLGMKAKLSYKNYSEQLSLLKDDPTEKETIITHELIVNEKIPLEKNDIIQLSIDLTTFPTKENSEIIRIENKTRATVIIRVFNEKNLGNVQIYPIQENIGGNIILERCGKLEPSKNFMIGIIVRDALNSAFGAKDKVLTKLVDVYAYDYNSYHKVVIK